MRRRNFSASLTLFAILPSSVFAETGDETKFDLIIIGIGAAGLSTAVSAAQNGVKNILLIDKAAFVGGHSALSGGSVNAVVPELQMKQGIKDSPEFWQRQIMETGEFQSDPVHHLGCTHAGHDRNGTSSQAEPKELSAADHLSFRTR